MSADLSCVDSAFKPAFSSIDDTQMHTGPVIVSSQFLQRVVIDHSRAIKELVTNSASAGKTRSLLMCNFQVASPFSPLDPTGVSPTGQTITLVTNTYMDKRTNSQALIIGSTKGTEHGSDLQTAANEHGMGLKSAAAAMGGYPAVLCVTQMSKPGDNLKLSAYMTYYSESAALVYSKYHQNTSEVQVGMCQACFSFTAEVVGSDILVNLDLPGGFNSKEADMVLIADHGFCDNKEKYDELTLNKIAHFKKVNAQNLVKCCENIVRDYIHTKEAFVRVAVAKRVDLIRRLYEDDPAYSEKARAVLLPYFASLTYSFVLKSTRGMVSKMDLPSPLPRPYSSSATGDMASAMHADREYDEKVAVLRYYLTNTIAARVTPLAQTIAEASLNAFRGPDHPMISMIDMMDVHAATPGIPVRLHSEEFYRENGKTSFSVPIRLPIGLGGEAVEVGEMHLCRPRSVDASLVRSSGSTAWSVDRCDSILAYGMPSMDGTSVQLVLNHFDLPNDRRYSSDLPSVKPRAGLFGVLKDTGSATNPSSPEQFFTGASNIFSDLERVRTTDGTTFENYRQSVVIDLENNTDCRTGVDGKETVNGVYALKVIATSCGLSLNGTETAKELETVVNDAMEPFAKMFGHRGFRVSVAMLEAIFMSSTECEKQGVGDLFKLKSANQDKDGDGSDNGLTFPKQAMAMCCGMRASASVHVSTDYAISKNLSKTTIMFSPALSLKALQAFNAQIRTAAVVYSMTVGCASYMKMRMDHFCSNSDFRSRFTTAEQLDKTAAEQARIMNIIYLSHSGGGVSVSAKGLVDFWNKVAHEPMYRLPVGDEMPKELYVKKVVFMWKERPDIKIEAHGHYGRGSAVVVKWNRYVMWPQIGRYISALAVRSTEDIKRLLPFEDSGYAAKCFPLEMYPKIKCTGAHAVALLAEIHRAFAAFEFPPEYYRCIFGTFPLLPRNKQDSAKFGQNTDVFLLSPNDKVYGHALSSFYKKVRDHNEKAWAERKAADDKACEERKAALARSRPPTAAQRSISNPAIAAECEHAAPAPREAGAKQAPVARQIASHFLDLFDDDDSDTALSDLPDDDDRNRLGERRLTTNEELLEVRDALQLTGALRGATNTSDPARTAPAQLSISEPTIAAECEQAVPVPREERAKRKAETPATATRQRSSEPPAEQPSAEMYKVLDDMVVAYRHEWMRVFGDCTRMPPPMFQLAGPPETPDSIRLAAEWNVKLKKGGPYSAACLQEALTMQRMVPFTAEGRRHAWSSVPDALTSQVQAADAFDAAPDAYELFEIDHQEQARKRQRGDGCCVDNSNDPNVIWVD